MSKEELLLDELIRTSKLNGKHRGELAELAFMRQAASLGFAIAKPWGESDRYDVVVRVGKIFWRVQVKSVLATTAGRREYRIKTVNSLHLPYTAEEIDFLAAYVFLEDTWYIFPATVVEGHKAITVCPGYKRSRYEQYREAWKLMEGTGVEPSPLSTAQAVTDAAPVM